MPVPASCSKTLVWIPIWRRARPQAVFVGDEGDERVSLSLESSWPWMGSPCRCDQAPRPLSRSGREMPTSQPVCVRVMFKGRPRSGRVSVVQFLSPWKAGPLQIQDVLCVHGGERSVRRAGVDRPCQQQQRPVQVEPLNSGGAPAVPALRWAPCARQPVCSGQQHGLP